MIKMASFSRSAVYAVDNSYGLPPDEGYNEESPLH
jgi:hypothetical protein